MASAGWAMIRSMSGCANACMASTLAGYTNLPLRLVVRELGGVGLCTTDLVNARSLLERRAKAFKLIESRPADQPLAVQLFGSVPEEMRDAMDKLPKKNRTISTMQIERPKVTRSWSSWGRP